jgi:hypothetical protein
MTSAEHKALCHQIAFKIQPTANCGGLPGDEDPNPGPGSDEPTGDGGR